MMAQALTPLNLHQVTRVKVHTLHCVQPHLGQTGSHQVFQMLVSQIRLLLVFQTRLGQTFLLSTKKSDEGPMDKFLWYGFWYRISIKDFLPEQESLCGHTWEVVACIVMTGEGRSSPNIWPETPNQDTSTERMILTIWYKEAIKQNGFNP